ncbi:calpain-7-like [Cyclopterus lumpus]|uniref:calpain-7-like n=1 Tax=Cyclopterus lumpus TaxID=8103 RepID=UPI001486BC93|nr:calpain-7-like [Cyclopterus lumpus]
MQVHLLQDPESLHSNQKGINTHTHTQTLCLCLSLSGGPSAGGCGNYKDSYKHNPIYQVNLERPGPLLVELRGSRQYSVGFEVVAVTVSTVGDPGPAAPQKRNSGDYRCGFCYMEADHVPAGLYNVIPTTFLPRQEGPFFLDFASTSALKVSLLQ